MENAALVQSYIPCQNRLIKTEPPIYLASLNTPSTPTPTQTLSKSLICPLRMPSPLSCRYKPYSTPPSLPHPIPWSVLQGPYTKQKTVPPSPTPLLYLTSTNLQACFLACRPNIQTMGLFHKILKYSIQGITLYLFNVNTNPLYMHNRSMKA